MTDLHNWALQFWEFIGSPSTCLDHSFILVLFNAPASCKVWTVQMSRALLTFSWLLSDSDSEISFLAGKDEHTPIYGLVLTAFLSI